MEIVWMLHHLVVPFRVLQEIRLVTDILDRPNGLAFSPDGELLWVANSNKKTASWTAFEVRDALPLKPVMVLSEGTEPSGQGRDSVSSPVPVHYLGEMPGKGVSDGFKIDGQGLIWSSMPAGLCILDPKPPTPHVVAKAGPGHVSKSVPQVASLATLRER